MFITEAFAMGQPGGDPAGGGSSFFIMMAMMFAIFYFLLIRPQQKKAKQHKAMLDNMKRGDDVVLGGGMLAKITKVKEDEDKVEVEISEGVKSRVVKSTILAVITKGEPTDGK